MLADAQPPEVDEQARDAKVLDHRRRRVRLGGLWSSQPLVLVFYLGADSDPCRAQLLGYRDSALSFARAGAQVAALSADEPSVSAWLRAERCVPFRLLCDPQQQALRAWGVSDGDGVSRPATFVIDRAGVVRMAALDEGDDRTPAEAVLLFLRRGGIGASLRLETPLQRLGRRLGLRA
jgi:peroxiredoxin Q/BCP